MPPAPGGEQHVNEPPLLLLGADLRAPRADRVDPETCPVCAWLHESLTAVITTNSPMVARQVLIDMHTHTFSGHPNDPRNAIRETSQ